MFLSGYELKLDIDFPSDEQNYNSKKLEERERGQRKRLQRKEHLRNEYQIPHREK